MLDAQSRIIKQLLDAIESTQTLPWRRGFRQLLPTNLSTGERYRGQNVFMLVAAQQLLNYGLSRWVGFVQFNQWREQNRDLWLTDKPPYIKGRGTQIIKVSQGKERVKTDCKGATVYKHSSVAVAEPEPQMERPQYLTLLTVFNAEQVQGLKPDALRVVVNPKPLPEKIITARTALLTTAQRIGVPVKFGEYMHPSYSLGQDMISSPHEGLYTEQTDIVSHLAHELVHATGCRLDRVMNADKRSKQYAEEELVAEMGAALLLANFDLDDTRAIENSAAYVQGWASFLKGNPSVFGRAAANAQKAADFILG